MAGIDNDVNAGYEKRTTVRGQTVPSFKKASNLCLSCRFRITSGMTDPASSSVKLRKNNGFRGKPGMTKQKMRGLANYDKVWERVA